MTKRRDRMVYSIAILGCVCFLWSGCAEDSDAPPVTAPSGTQFLNGQTVPGYVLNIPEGNRADVTATGVWSSTGGTSGTGGWDVLLKRELKPRPADTYFSLVLTEDSHNHTGDNLLKLTFDPKAAPDANTIVGRRIANDGITMDGVIDGNDDWNTGYFSEVDCVPQNNYPLNEFTNIEEQTMTVGAAYDDEYVYFLLRWQDQAGGGSNASQSDIRNLWQNNGGSAGDISDWSKRPHAGNDSDGNGIIDGAEIKWYGGTESEDRIFFMFPITDTGGNFRTGGAGCATYCHANLDQDPIGGAAAMSTNFTDELSDTWHWKAARTHPAGFADDKKIVYDADQGNGRKSDAGTSAYSEQKTALTLYYATPQTDIHTPLVRDNINYAEWTLAGYSEPANLASNSATGMPGLATTFVGNDAAGIAAANSFIPYAFMRQAAGSRGDVQVKATFSAGYWTAEFRRLRITRDISGGAGLPIIAYGDDHQFETDANFYRDGLMVATAANGMQFSLAVYDNGHADEDTKSKYIGPFTLSGDTSLANATSTSGLYIHDYGVSWTPTGTLGSGANDFDDTVGNVLDPAFTTTGTGGAGTQTGTDVNMLLRAGTDGTYLYVLATWDDATKNDKRNQWTYNAGIWTQKANSSENNEDRLIFAFDISADFNSDPWNYGGGGFETGCASFCHDTDSDGIGDVMRTENVGQLVDVWHWKATRTNPVGYSDDQYVDWVTAEPAGDAGRSAYSNNKNAAGDAPKYMGPNDPGENPAIIFFGVSGEENRVIIDTGTGVGGGAVSFAYDVQPILNTKCVSCHGASGGLNLANYTNVVSGGNNGATLVVGDSSASMLVQRIDGTVGPLMPLGLDPLSDYEIQLIEDWIDQGALDN